MVTEADTKGAAVKIPPPLIALIVLLAAYGLHRWFPFELSSSRLLLPLGILIIALALIIIAIAVVAFFRAKTHIEPWKPTSSIISTGIYSFTRNPIYLAFCIASIGIGLLLNSAWVLISFLPLAILLYWLVIRREENYLQYKFKKQYSDYKKRVRRWL